MLNTSSARTVKADRAGLIIRHADGWTEGRDPSALTHGELQAAGHAQAPLLKVIRAKCVECCGGSRAEVARCALTDCLLWPYRMATNPFARARGRWQEIRRQFGGVLGGKWPSRRGGGPVMTAATPVLTATTVAMPFVFDDGGRAAAGYKGRNGELPIGRLIVSVSKHLVAVVDGVIHDTHDPSRAGTRCVYGYWRSPTEAAP
jgi:hypothetical protein